MNAILETGWRFVCGSLDSGGMAGIAHRAAMRVTAPLSGFQLDAEIHVAGCAAQQAARRAGLVLELPPQDAGGARRRGWGLLPALGGEQARPSGVLVPQVALT